jgi:hypothetical protein
MYQSAPRANRNRPTNSGARSSSRNATPVPSSRRLPLKRFPSFSLPPSSPPIPQSPSDGNLRIDRRFMIPVRDVANPLLDDTDEDPFGFLTAERKLKRDRPRPSARKQKSPSPALDLGSGIQKDLPPTSLVDYAYDSNDDLYASRTPDIFPTPQHARQGGIVPSQPGSSTAPIEAMPSRNLHKRQAPSTPSSLPSHIPSRHTTPRQRSPRRKRARTGKENPPVVAEEAEHSSPPRPPLVAKEPLRRSTRVASKSHAPVKPRTKIRNRSKQAEKKTSTVSVSNDSEDDGSGEDEQRDKSHRRLAKAEIFPETSAYKAEREARKAYFKKLDEYNLKTEKVYIV